VVDQGRAPRARRVGERDLLSRPGRRRVPGCDQRFWSVEPVRGRTAPAAPTGRRSKRRLGRLRISSRSPVDTPMQPRAVAPVRALLRFRSLSLRGCGHPARAV